MPIAMISRRGASSGNIIIIVCSTYHLYKPVYDMQFPKIITE